MRWNFFGSSHGNGDHDGAGVVIKQAHVINFLRTHMSTSAASVYSSQVRDIKRVFWEVRIDELNREKRSECHGIPELRSLHVVRGYSRTGGHYIAVRELTCFYFHCVQENW